MMSRKTQRGDTLVEVLIATSILGAAIVGGLTAMNAGYAVASNSVERTQVQATMNSQLAMIKYARDAFFRANQQASDNGSKLWVALMSKVTTAASSQTVCNGNVPQPVNGFYINDDLSTLTDTSVIDYSGTAATALAAPGAGMWIEGRQSSGGSVKYVDFYVKACWQAIGTSPQQEERTVMRLYVP